MTLPELEEDIPTAKTCPECRGEGTRVIETGTRYTVETCRWCRGSGRVPVSGQMKAIK
jgi:DnaJ-class molecular chaperone